MPAEDLLSLCQSVRGDVVWKPSGYTADLAPQLSLRVWREDTHLLAEITGPHLFFVRAEDHKGEDLGGLFEKLKRDLIKWEESLSEYLPEVRARPLCGGTARKLRALESNKMSVKIALRFFS